MRAQKILKVKIMGAECLFKNKGGEFTLPVLLDRLETVIEVLKERETAVTPELVKENKSMSRTWARAITASKKWSFNTFAIGMKKNKNNQLCDDIFQMIYNFL